MAIHYRGRFAPSPTGQLHLGSLLAAVASFLDARHNHGDWLVRIEDLDPPREVPGAASDILRTLEAFSLTWDEDVWYQSNRHDAYQAVIEQLLQDGQAYYCTCSRKLIKTRYGGRYPGTCRPQHNPPAEPAAIRLQLPDPLAGFNDLLQGRYDFPPNESPEDCVLKRRDGWYAYHLAVVVDDEAQNINTIVRGADLLDSTPIHRYLQQQLGYALPAYCHLPLVVNSLGQKLSKQNLARPVDPTRAGTTLWQLLNMLNQNPPEELSHAGADELLGWAAQHWNRTAVGLTALQDAG